MLRVFELTVEYETRYSQNELDMVAEFLINVFETLLKLCPLRQISNILQFSNKLVALVCNKASTELAKRMTMAFYSFTYELRLDEFSDAEGEFLWKIIESFARIDLNIRLHSDSFQTNYLRVSSPYIKILLQIKMRLLIHAINQKNREVKEIMLLFTDIRELIKEKIESRKSINNIIKYKLILIDVLILLLNDESLATRENGLLDILFNTFDLFGDKVSKNMKLPSEYLQVYLEKLLANMDPHDWSNKSVILKMDIINKLLYVKQEITLQDKEFSFAYSLKTLSMWRSLIEISLSIIKGYFQTQAIENLNFQQYSQIITNSRSDLMMHIQTEFENQKLGTILMLQK